MVRSHFYGFDQALIVMSQLFGICHISDSYVTVKIVGHTFDGVSQFQGFGHILMVANVTVVWNLSYF